MKFNIIIVCYNTYLSNNKFLDSYKSSNDSVFIYVYDNSINTEILLKNKEYTRIKKINYYSDGNNIGLSKAYNYVVQKIEKQIDSWILILDQDTHISFEDIKIYEKDILNNKDKKIFTPVILDSIGIMSPSTIKKSKYIHTKKIDTDNMDKYSYINSCMCINSDIFNEINYDENLFLDCIDHDFVQSLKNKFGSDIFYIMNDLKIYQEFSGAGKNSLNSDLIRFKIFIKDYSYFYNKWKTNSKSLLFTRALKLSVLHKNFIFLKEYYNFKRKCL